MINRLLPLGSVVTLEEARNKIMIIGIAQQNEETNEIYDYLGLPFPEGFVDDEVMFLFNHKDIEEVHYIGYVNAEAQTFRMQLMEQLDKDGIVLGE